MIALQQATCRDYMRLLGPYLDGECEAATLIDVESHVTHCSPCREHVELMRAARASLKRVVRTTAPSGLRARMATAMLAEQARSEVRNEPRDTTPSAKFGWRTMVPLASAAALALFWGAASRGPAANGKELAAGVAVGDDLLAEFVHEHAQPLPPEAIDARAVRGLEKYVGVPVHPGRFERNGAKLVGARVMPLHMQRAAMLQYLVTNGDETRRVSVLVFDPSKIKVNDADLLPRSVGTAQVQAGMQKGYSVAYAERSGVAYAVASDRDAAQLAAMIYTDDQ